MTGRRRETPNAAACRRISQASEQADTQFSHSQALLADCAVNTICRPSAALSTQRAMQTAHKNQATR